MVLPYKFLFLPLKPASLKHAPRVNKVKYIIYMILRKEKCRASLPCETLASRCSAAWTQSTSITFMSVRQSGWLLFIQARRNLCRLLYPSIRYRSQLAQCLSFQSTCFPPNLQILSFRKSECFGSLPNLQILCFRKSEYFGCLPNMQILCFRKSKYFCSLLNLLILCFRKS